MLATSFPNEIDELFKAVAIRHDVVRRNGKDTGNNAIVVTMEEVRALAQLGNDMVRFIDKQVKDGLLEDDEPADQ